MLSILCARLTIKVKVGIPESFKVGWYPPKKTGSSHLNDSFYKQIKVLLTIIIVVVSAFINHCVIKINRLMTNKTNEQTGKKVAKHHAVVLSF